MVVDKSQGPVMLYDGVCGFCTASVQNIIKLDHRAIFRFAALQSEFGQQVLSRHPELKGVDSVVVVEDKNGTEEVSVRSTAVLRIIHYLGGLWKIFLAGYLMPRPLRDFFYDLVARNRYRLFGKHESCMIPSPDVRARFID